MTHLQTNGHNNTDKENNMPSPGQIKAKAKALQAKADAKAAKAAAAGSKCNSLPGHAL
jgi:hypothetical protein